MSHIPFTQGWEDAKVIVGDRRSDATTEQLYKRLYNLVYSKAIPQALEWDMFRADFTPLILRADYQTGTLAVTNASTSVTLTGGTFPTTMNTQWKLRLLSGSDTDDIYEISSRDSGTTATLNRAFSGTTASGLSFIVYQDMVSLPSNFDRFTANPKIWTREGGRNRPITFKEDGQFLAMQAGEVGVPTECRIHPDRDSSGLYQLQFNKGWEEETLIYGEYIKVLDDLTEYVTGSVAVTNNSASVTGTSTLWNTNVAVGDYFRVDDNGEWYKITAVGGDTGITLEAVYRGATASGKAYTIAKAPVDIPQAWQSAITYGIAALAAAHQDDEQGFRRWQAMSGIPAGALANLARAESRLTYGTQRMRTIYQKPGVRR